MDIKPFKAAIEAAVPDKGLVSVRGFYRRLRLLFGNYTISADGIDLSQPDQNRLHLKVTANGSGSSAKPFQVTIKALPTTGYSIYVTPGLINSAHFPDNQGKWIVPLLGSTLINADPVPSITAAGDGHVVLKAEFDTDGSAANLPWAITFSSTLQTDQRLIRINSVGIPQQGYYYFPIAQIKDNIVYQWVQGNILVNLRWEQLYAWG